MAVMMPSAGVSLEAQLLSIMDVLVKAAVAEISQLFSESSSTLRLHLTQSLRENDSLRMRLKLMRSELFSLKLQSRAARPCSRFTLQRSSTPKPRAKPPPAVPVAEVSKDSDAFTVTEKSSDGECPDIIVIKDEEESEGCSIINGDVSHSIEPQIDSPTDITDDQTVDVPSEEQNTFLNQADTFYNSAEPLTFTSNAALPLPQNPTMTQSNSEHLRIIDIFGMTIPNQSPQGVSMPLNHEAGFQGSSSSPPAPKQLKTIAKTLSCNVCSEQFNTRSELNAHRASHTGDSPVTCNMCDKVFVSKNTLAIHMRIHTGVKPYVCLLCGKRFTQNGGLRIHLRTHSGEKPFTCAVCQTSFNNPSNLRRHMITHNVE